MATRLSQDAAQSNMTAATFNAHLQSISLKREKMDELHAEYKTAQSEYRSERKRFVKAGGDEKALAYVEGLSRMDDDVRVLHIKLSARYAKFMRLDIGEQTNLFDADDEQLSLEDIAAAENVQAGQDGYNRGIAGDSQDENPHPGGTEQHVAWHAGWKRGHEAHAKANGAPVKKSRGRQAPSGNPEDAATAP